MSSHVGNAPGIGPSDSSDAGSDLVGLDLSDDELEVLSENADRIGNPGLDASSDRSGTGERMSAGTESVHDAADIGFDRVVDAGEAGLGAGLDQAEEAQLGITDEEIEDL